MEKNQENKIQELQMLEHNLQNILMQKQAFQLEISETSSAIKEIEKSNSDVYKIIGQLMIKKDSKEIKEELKNKERLMKLRIGNLNKQEISITEQADKIREEILGPMNKE